MNPSENNMADHVEPTIGLMHEKQFKQYLDDVRGEDTNW